jgi:hypothetical protein
VISVLQTRASSIIIPTAFRMKLLKTFFESSDPSFAATNVTFVTIVVVHYTVLAASFAHLEPFLRAFNSNSGRYHNDGYRRSVHQQEVQ